MTRLQTLVNYLLSSSKSVKSAREIGNEHLGTFRIKDFKGNGTGFACGFCCTLTVSLLLCNPQILANKPVVCLQLAKVMK